MTEHRWADVYIREDDGVIVTSPDDLAGLILLDEWVGLAEDESRDMGKRLAASELAEEERKQAYQDGYEAAIKQIIEDCRDHLCWG